MRHQKLSTTIIGLCILNSLCMAGQTQQSPKTPKVPITLVKVNKGVSARRPKAPDRQIVTCAYDGEELHLSLVIPEGMATLSVTDETLLTSIYEFDTTSLEVSVPAGDLIGTISIEMETDNNTYCGQIE